MNKNKDFWERYICRQKELWKISESNNTSSELNKTIEEAHKEYLKLEHNLRSRISFQEYCKLYVHQKIQIINKMNEDDNSTNQY